MTGFQKLVIFGIQNSESVIWCVYNKRAFNSKEMLMLYTAIK